MGSQNYIYVLYTVKYIKICQSAYYIKKIIHFNNYIGIY